MTHLAIGDYYYQRRFLAELKDAFPNIELDIWIDDCRSRPKAWHTGRNQTLSQWLGAESHIHEIYPIVGDRAERNSQIEKAKNKNYDIVFFIARSRSEQFAKYARQIAPQGWVVGTKNKPFENIFSKLLHFNKIDGWLDYQAVSGPKDIHITELYKSLFSKLTGVNFDSANSPLQLELPEEITVSAKKLLQGIDKKWGLKESQHILLNHLSTNAKRDYPFDKLAALIVGLHQQQNNRVFVINTPPANLQKVQEQIANSPELQNIPVIAFTAKEHFFQLPALIANVDAVITVETAIMHLASGFRKPQIVLMRESAKQWQPLNASKVLFASHRVANIEPEQVIEAFSESV